MDALSILNMEKLKAQQQKQWGWQSMPDYIELYEISDGWMHMPRGFAGDLAEGLIAFESELEFDDRRIFEQVFRVGTPSEPMPWQEPAIQAIIDHQQGIYKAPAGSGKTVTVLLAIHRLAVKSIVIVNTKDILWQWQQRVVDHLGEHYPVGQIGDNIFNVSPYLTIATAQTLHSRFEELEEDGFFDQFSFMCLDECHHAQADTYRRVVDRFSSRYRIGVSATPDKTGDFALATNVLGRVFHETRPRDVTNLIKPEVIRVTTNFSFGFRGTRSAWQRSNYPQMVDALIRNQERNKLIVDRIVENAGHHQLVISKRLEHLDIIEEMLLERGLEDPIVKIRGVDDNDHRQQAKALAEVEPCVLLSTLADEAMDIPRLDRLHMTFPQKNPGLVTQQVGRVERKHPEKADALIYDYCDAKVGVLDNQWRTRRREVYIPRGYNVTTWRPE